MHRIHRSVLVPYSSHEMFALVSDVGNYPLFLPWCPASHVQPGTQPDQVRARVDIAYLGVRSHFTTCNTLVPDRSIALELVDGPFRDLHGRWDFHALGEAGCKVTLELHYRMAAGVLARALAPVFERVAHSLIEAFTARARVLHGDRLG